MTRSATSQQQVTNSREAKMLDLLFNLYLLGRKMKQAAKKYHSKHTQDHMLEWGVLRLVAKEPRSVTQLAQLLSTGMSAMSERVTSLKERGLVIQMTSDDGREMRCQITTQGKKIITDSEMRVQQTCLQLQDTISEQEIDTIKPILQKLLTWNL